LNNQTKSGYKVNNKSFVEFIVNKLCGEGGIRTLDTLYRGILT